MKRHPLERTLIYTDKSDLNEFEIPEAAFDELYELYVTTKDEVLEDYHTSVDFFNEVFYYLTCAYANNDSAENINEYLYSESALLPSHPEFANPQTKQEAAAAREYEQRTEEINIYVLEFAWVILKKQKELPKNVRFFLIALGRALEDEDNFSTFEDFVKKHPAKYSISLELRPEAGFDVLLRTTEEWKSATDDFDREVINHIVHRFYEIEDRETVVKEIRKALTEANKDPNSHPKASMVTHRKKATDAFLDELLQKGEAEKAQRIEEAQAVEKSKDETIAEMQELLDKMKAENMVLKREKNEAIIDRKDAERERDKYRKKYEELINRLNRKYIPAELKTEEAKLIIDELIKRDIISPLGHNNGIEFSIQCYRWDKSGALFGYFIDKMNFQLELADSGGRLNWKIFKCAFGNFEEKEKRARDTVSFYKQHPEEKMPENAEKIDEAISAAEKILAASHKGTPSLPKMPKI